MDSRNRDVGNVVQRRHPGIVGEVGPGSLGNLDEHGQVAARIEHSGPVLDVIIAQFFGGKDLNSQSALNHVDAVQDAGIFHWGWAASGGEHRCAVLEAIRRFPLPIGQPIAVPDQVDEFRSGVPQMGVAVIVLAGQQYRHNAIAASPLDVHIHLSLGGELVAGGGHHPDHWHFGPGRPQVFGDAVHQCLLFGMGADDHDRTQVVDTPGLLQYGHHRGVAPFQAHLGADPQTTRSLGLFGSGESADQDGVVQLGNASVHLLRARAGEPVDHREDLFVLGQLQARRLCGSGAHWQEQLRHHLEAPPEDAPLLVIPVHHGQKRGAEVLVGQVKPEVGVQLLKVDG